MSIERQQLEAGIAALESQSALLGDAVVNAALESMRARLASLSTSLPTADISPQELRQVSILFLDVVGSTTLSQRLDPEEIGNVMDETLSRATDVVRAHRGKVLQYAGDSLLAAFGAEAAAEDDAERAVLCGLALLALGRVLGAEVQAAHSHRGFNVRVGIHTGGVLLGGGVEAGSIRGLAVNVAARMEQSAPTGTLRISHETFTHVRGLFDVERQEPLLVKGVDTAITSYLVRGALQRTFRVITRGVEGVRTRMVGRVDELQQLKNAFIGAVGSSAGLHEVLVVGDAGVGKSRLLYEFENWVEDRTEAIHVLRARATPQTQSQPYGLLRNLAYRQWQIHDGDSMQTAKRKIEEGMAAVFSEDESPFDVQARAHLLGQLIGLDFSASRHIAGIKDDGQQIRDRAFHTAAQSLRRAGRRGHVAVVLLLDDLHWADDASLNFIDYLVEANRDVQMLLLGLARATLFERRPAFASRGERINLYPLDEAASDFLAGELLQHFSEPPTALWNLVTDVAEGNPFYMEELVRMAIDRGAVVTGSVGESWSLDAQKLHSMQIPSTITGVLQARLDALPQVERHAMQMASVVGLNFWEPTLAHVEPQAVEQLPALSNRELVHPLDAPDDLQEYAFQHQILHQVTYETLLKRDRKAAHGRAAQWFAQNTGPMAKVFLATAAEHYEQAGDNANAAEFYAQAAEHMAGNFAHEMALRFTARALALAPSSNHVIRWRLLANRERTFDLMGARSQQMADIESLFVLAEELDDDALRADVAWRRCDIAMRTGDWQTQEREARRAQSLAERVGAEELSLRALQRLAFAIADQGDPQTGRVLAQKGLARARALGSLTLQSLFANALAICAQLVGDSVSNLESALLMLRLGREEGNRRLEALALNNVGMGYLDLGAHTPARQHLLQALEMNRAIGNREIEGGTLGALSCIALRQGENELALTHAQAGLEICIEVGARWYQCDAWRDIGNAELALENWAAAAAAFEHEEAIGREFDFLAKVLDAIDGSARVALSRGDMGTATQRGELLLAMMSAAVKQSASGRTTPLVGAQQHRIRLTVAQVWARVHDPRAQLARRDAQEALQTAASAINDEALRESFLMRIPEHRKILEI